MLVRVAILTGGGDRPYALGLAASLIAAGVAFDFIGSDDLESAVLRNSPNVCFLNLRGDMRPDVPALRKVARVAKYYARLIAYAVSSRAGVFHVLWNNKIEWFDRTLLLAFYKLLGKRVVLTVHNVNIRKRDGNDNAWNRFTLRLQYRLVDHLFVHTQRMCRELEAEFEVLPRKISVIPFGINSTVPETALTPDQARSHLGLAVSQKILLFFGNIAPYKGLEYLVEAFAQLQESLPEARLVIAGRPKGVEPYWASIEERIGELNLGGRVVRRIEYVPDSETEIYFKAADLLVLPYTHVFQSGVLFLGYNFGVPVVVSDVGSLTEDIVEGRTGFACKAADPGALAEAIVRYFSSDLYHSLAAQRPAIRHYAHERYSWSTVASISRSVYATAGQDS